MICVLIVAMFIGLDQYIKMLVNEHLKPVGTHVVIDDFFELKYLENTGASFGSFQELTGILTIVSIIGCLIVLYILLSYKKHNFISYFSCVCVLAGGVGNIIDRISLGYVIDYLHFYFFPYVFNLADSLVVVGVFAYAIYVIFFTKSEKIKESSTENK